MESSSLTRSIKDGERPLGRNATDDEEEEAEVAFVVLFEQGKEVAAEASRASSSI